MAGAKGQKVKCGSCDALTNDAREICDFCGAKIRHADGSPFRLSPAPVDPKEEMPTAKEASPSPPESAPFAPPPLPVPPRTDTFPTPAGRALFGVFSAGFILRATLGATHADWLAAGLFATGAQVVLLNVDSRSPRRSLWGFLACLVALCCLYKSGLPAQGWAPARGQGLDLFLLLLAGLALGGAACILGFVEGEKRLPLGLLVGSTVAMAAWAALVRLSPEASWKEFPGVLLSDVRAFVGSDGPRRWGGLALIYLGSFVFFPGKKDYGPRPKIVNWSA